jgi:hypothetical protein
MANFKSLILEAALESYRKELEDYLRSKGGGTSNAQSDGRPGDGRRNNDGRRYNFPYLPGHTVSIEKNYMGDYGYAVKVTVIGADGTQKAAARVLEGSVHYLDENGRKVSEASTVSGPAGLFGRLVEIV